MANANVVTWAGRTILNLRAANTAGNSPTQPVFIGWGNSQVTATAVTGSAFSDVGLFSSFNGVSGTEARVLGVASFMTTNTLADTFVLTGTITANGAKTVSEVAIYDNGANTWSAVTNSTSNLANTITALGVLGTTGQGLPTSGNYYAQWENEVVLVTAGQGSNALTITRGQLGSSNSGPGGTATHTAGAVISAGGDGGAHTANASIGAATFIATGANSGSCFAHADFANIGLANNDSIQFTLKTQLA